DGDTETDASTVNPAIRMWRYGRWNYLLMISNFFAEELPMILLKVFSSNNSQVGWFSRARAVSSYPRLATLPISQVLFPFTAASTPEDATRRTQILCRNWFSIMVVAVGLLAVFVKPIIVLLFGEEFLPSASIFYALAPGVVFYPLLHFTEVHVAAAGKPKLVAGASFLTFLVAALSCWWLIPGHAAVGAGLSVSITYATGTLLRLTVFKKITGSSISDILVPRSSDWSYFRDIWNKLFSNTNRN
ncbi:MAG: oligosaccharide flippase family protein, partial [Candidatus Krumholzibacteria bacterium]|nr:oligosaccharide flippase family protein [Candidatus Krumholzibacteria bacterium]